MLLLHRRISGGFIHFKSLICIRTITESFIHKTLRRVSEVKMLFWFFFEVLQLQFSKAAFQGYIDVQRSHVDKSKYSVKVSGRLMLHERPTETADQSSYRSVGDIFNGEVKLRAKCYFTLVATSHF